MLGIITTNSAQGIIIPILTEYYHSFFFILIITSMQFTVLFGVAYLIIFKGSPKLPEKKLVLLSSGLSNGLMAICLIYSASPNRTPIMIQTILAGLPILPSALFRKFLINRIVIYHKWFILSSVAFLLTAIGLSTIPVDQGGDTKMIPWILLYAVGIIFLSLYNVLQEKYITETEDYSLQNKISLIFYSRLIQLIVVIAFSWLEIVIGYNKSPLDVFIESAKKFVHNGIAFGLLEGFVISYILSYIMCVYLNTISTNFTMITPIISNPIVVLFFTIFEEFNDGIVYPLWLIILCILLSLIGALLWLKGETRPIPVSSNTYFVQIQ